MGVNTAKRAEQNATIAGLRSQGMNCRDIGKELNLSHSQIAKRLKDSDIQDILSETLKYYATYADKIAFDFIALCDHEDPVIRGKNIAEYHKVMGMNSPHTSIFIQNLYQDNRKQIISPHVQAIINQYSSNLPIDVELIEDKSSKGE